MLVATGTDGKTLLTPNEVAAIFYIALTQHLTRTSVFRDSRRTTVLAARSLFRALPADESQKKVGAVESSFEAVGIR